MIAKEYFRELVLRYENWRPNIQTQGRRVKNRTPRHGELDQLVAFRLRRNCGGLRGTYRVRTGINCIAGDRERGAKLSRQGRHGGITLAQKPRIRQETTTKAAIKKATSSIQIWPSMPKKLNF
jgi:hypothetical protein